MSNYKKLEDRVILDELLRALKTNKKKLAENLGYASHMSIYYVANGRNHITNDMADRIMLKYPEVNYLFITKGELPVLKSKPGTPEPKNDLNIHNKKESITLQDLESIPKRLSDIENRQFEMIALLKQILEQSKSDQS